MTGSAKPEVVEIMTSSGWVIVHMKAYDSLISLVGHMTHSNSLWRHYQSTITFIYCPVFVVLAIWHFVIGDVIVHHNESFDISKWSVRHKRLNDVWLIPMTSLFRLLPVWHFRSCDRISGFGIFGPLIFFTDYDGMLGFSVPPVVLEIIGFCFWP